MKSMFGRSLLRFALVASFVCFFVSARPAAACDWLPTEYETTIRYYSASQQPVGWEKYHCGGGYTSNGTLSGTWLEETDINCCTGQQQHAYFYLCPSDGLWHQVNAIGDTNCS